MEEVQLSTESPSRRPMYVRVRVADGDALYAHKARNITAKGLFIDAPVPLAAGTRVEIEFRAPDERTFTCAASVAWNTEAGGAKAPHPGFGVVFEELDAEQRRALEALVGA